MHTYELIEGGYNIFIDGKLARHQPHNPDTGLPYSAEEALIIAEGIVNNSNETVSTATLVAAQAAKIRQIGSDKLSAIASPYMPEERTTWPSQLAESEAWLADNTAETPIVDALAAARGVTKEDLINKIMGNANLFRTASGTVLGQQQHLLDELEALPSDATEAQITAITWS